MKTAAVLVLCLERASATLCSCKASWSNSDCSNQAGCPPTTCDDWHTNWCEVDPTGCEGSTDDGTYHWMHCDGTTTWSGDLDGDGEADAAPEGSCCIVQYGVGFDTACGSTLTEVTANCCPSPFVARYHLGFRGEETTNYDCVSFISKEDCNTYGQTWSGGDDDPIGLGQIGGCPHSAAALDTALKERRGEWHVFKNQNRSSDATPASGPALLATVLAAAAAL